MGYSRAGHRVSRSFHVIPTSAAVLSITSPFSPPREYSFSSTLRPNKGGYSASIIAPKDNRGFQSHDPTSPQVSCIGQIKLKHKLVEKAGKDKENRNSNNKVSKGKGKSSNKNNNNNNVVSKLKRLMFRRQKSNKKAEKGEEEARKGEKERSSIATYSSLGDLRRYTSGSYDAIFGDMFVREEPIVAKSGLLTAEPVPKQGPKLKGDTASPSIWKRRSVPPLKALEVSNNARVEGFEARKPFTT